MSRGRGRAVELTEGPLIRPLIVLSVPIVLTNLLQVGYNLADTFWVGRLGADAVSALSFSWAILFLLIAMAAGFTVAGTVLVAQHKGAGHHDRINHVAGQTVAFVLLLSVALSAIGFALAPALLALVGAEPGTRVFALAVEYTRTMFAGLPFVFGFFVFQSLLQGWGDTRTPFYLMLFGVVLNVLIDPFFILGFDDNLLLQVAGLGGVGRSLFAQTGFTGFGVQGAALATILSRGLGAALAIGLLLSGRVGIRLSPRDLVLEAATVRKILSIGGPASIEMSNQAIGVTALTAVVAVVGADAVAAFGIGIRVTSLVVLPAIGLARGTETAVGQNLGAGRSDRARRAVFASATIATVVLVVVSAVVYATAEGIIAVFITGERAATVIAIGADYLRIVGATYVFLGVFHVVQGGFRGSGSTRIAMVLGIVGLVLLRVPPAYLLLVWLDAGAVGVWYGIALANVAMVVLAGAWFLRGTWTERVVDTAASGPPAPEE